MKKILCIGSLVLALAGCGNDKSEPKVESVDRKAVNFRFAKECVSTAKDAHSMMWKYGLDNKTNGHLLHDADENDDLYLSVNEVKELYELLVNYGQKMSDDLNGYLSDKEHYELMAEVGPKWMRTMCGLRDGLSAQYIYPLEAKAVEYQQSR